MAKGTKYSRQFKEDAVQYRLDHPELSLRKAADNLGISESALKNWMKTAMENKGTVLTRGSGNYAVWNPGYKLNDSKVIMYTKIFGVSYNNNDPYVQGFAFFA